MNNNMNSNINTKYEKIAQKAKEEGSKNIPIKEFEDMLLNASDIDFITPFNYKKNDEFYNIGFQVSKLYHSTSDYPKCSILSCFDGFEIIWDCVESKIKQKEIEIAIYYDRYNYISKITKDLIKHKDEIRKYIITEKIDSFTLDNSNKYSEIYNKDRYPYNPYCYPTDILYDNTTISNLYYLNKILWQKIERIIRELHELNILFGKILKPNHDEDVFHSDEDTLNALYKDYNNLFDDYDCMDDDEYKEEYINEHWFYTRNSILYLVKRCASEHKEVLRTMSDDFYMFYLRKNVSSPLYQHLLDSYRCVVDGYEIKLKHIFENNK